MGTGLLPDQTVADAAGTIINSGVLGALVILCVALLLLQQYLHRKEIKDEREAHNVTREKQIEEIRNFSTLGREQQEQQATLERVILTKEELQNSKLDAILTYVRNERGRAA